tara:strand:- start:2089 stop:2418 length:330 start_codon:yes stop_codon:yes gene_type:complete
MDTDTLGRAVIGGLCKSLEIDIGKRGAVSRLSEQTEIPYRTLHAWLKDGKSPSAAHASELGDRFGLILLRHPGGRWLVMPEGPAVVVPDTPAGLVAAAASLGRWPGGEG